MLCLFLFFKCKPHVCFEFFVCTLAVSFVLDFFPLLFFQYGKTIYKSETALELKKEKKEKTPTFTPKSAKIFTDLSLAVAVLPGADHAFL